ncbi:MAG: arylmalonate decarboxylase [Actinomycetota bacterium]
MGFTNTINSNVGGIDQLGWRRKFGVIIPSTNTIVEPEFHAMSVPGVTAHTARIHIRNQVLDSDEAFQNLLLQIREEIGHAVARVVTCEPDYMVMGMSAETFWDGVDGNRKFIAQIKEQSGLDVATGAEACERALKMFGVRRIGVVTPYQPIGDTNVVKFFGELGFEVAAIEGLKCPTAVTIAHVGEAELRAALLKVDGPDVDALVQVGTNLSMIRLADEMERFLDKPVIAINAATWWMALRDNGVTEQLHGFGTLLREY